VGAGPLWTTPFSSKIYTMSQGFTTVRTASKDILARCLATEDITVEHRADAQTAYFDTDNRVLCLPVWKDMDNALYDMLVGHEVSHALHTPSTGWQEFIGDGPGSRMRHMFVNVIEDARIERLIKSQFPGLRRDFASAYKNLSERDLFEIAGKDITDLPLIDRLNLESKLGMLGLADIPFSTDEQQYVTRQNETKTFEEVVTLARELYEMQVEEDKQREQEQEESEEGQPAPGEGEGEEGEGQGSGPDSGDDDESGEGQGSSGADGDEESDESGSGSSGAEGNDESGEDSGQSMTDDTDDGESAESTEGEGESASDLSYDDYSNNQDCAGSTQNAFERGVNNMRDDECGDYRYSTLADANLDNIVVDHSVIADLWSPDRLNHWNEKRYVEHRATSAARLREYQNSIKATVGSMVQQFQMKQAADADKKTEIAKTGVLDTVTMINYRWSEDIFRKNEVHPEGKNHGMIIYLDWSGSMSGILQDTVEQLLVLVEFCRKVGIPYEVYAFSSNLYCPHERYGDEWDEWHKNQPEQWTKNRESDCDPHILQLYNFLSSRMNKRQYQDGLSNLWLLTEGICHYGGHPTPSCLNLGCTPLNEAIVCAMQQVPAFQSANGIQIVNTVFLTDGEGHSMGLRGYRGYGSKKGKSFVTDRRSKKNYDVSQNETDGLLEMLRDQTGTNLVGVRLHDAKNLNHMRWTIDNDAKFEELQKQYKTQNYITLPSAYDEYFIVKGNLKVETDALENLGDHESYTRIKNAFMKGGNRKKSSRVIASKMVDIFAA